MKVFIDGVEHRVLNDVKVILPDVLNNDEHELHLTLTHQGIITDIVEQDEIIDSCHAEYTDNLPPSYDDE